MYNPLFEWQIIIKRERDELSNVYQSRFWNILSAMDKIGNLAARACIAHFHPDNIVINIPLSHRQLKNQRYY